MFTQQKGEKKARTPAERAGIKLNLGKQFRLLNLITLYFFVFCSKFQQNSEILGKFCYYCEKILQNDFTQGVC
jgi:hypothetical protein